MAVGVSITPSCGERTAISADGGNDGSTDGGSVVDGKGDGALPDADPAANTFVVAPTSGAWTPASTFTIAVDKDAADVFGVTLGSAVTGTLTTK